MGLGSKKQLLGPLVKGGEGGGVANWEMKVVSHHGLSKDYFALT